MYTRKQKAEYWKRLKIGDDHVTLEDLVQEKFKTDEKYEIKMHLSGDQSYIAVRGSLYMSPEFAFATGHSYAIHPGRDLCCTPTGVVFINDGSYRVLKDQWCTIKRI